MEKVDSHAPRPLAREADLVVQKFPDEVMVYDLRNHKAHCLNQTAALVWRHCDGQRSVSEIAALLARETDSPVSEEVVWYALDKLNKAALLEEKIAVPVTDAMSRRRMVKRVGALVVLPAVISLIAPAAHAQVSVIITSKKIADGQCNNQNNPQSCTDDTCCTGTKRTCVQIGVGPGGLANTACVGVPCAPAGNASPCSSGT
jgi:hypothetical protein